MSQARSSSLNSTNQTLQLTSTPFNPYRWSKRQVVFPIPPNILNPSPIQPPASESVSPASPEPELVPFATTSTSTVNVPSENRIRLTEEDKEALKQLLFVYKS